jgi:hypothetical protein
MTKRTKTIGEIFDEGKALDAAAKRAVQRVLKASARAAKPRKSTAKSRRRAV